MLFTFLQPLAADLSPEEKNHLGSRIGDAFRILIPYRRQLIWNNLRIAAEFYALDNWNQEQLLADYYQHMGCMAIENLWLKGMNQTKIASIMKRGNPQDPSWAILDSGESVIIAMGHLGNWEVLIKGYRQLTGHSLFYVTKKIKSSSTNFFVHQLREEDGTRMIPTEQAREVLYPLIQSGKIIGLAADQSAPVDSHWDHFLGKRVPVFLGPATFSLKFGRKLVFMAPIRDSDGTFSVFSEEIRTDDLLGQAGSEARFELTSRYLRLLEKYIRHYPAQYYWIHRRWKHSHLAPTVVS